MKRFKIGKKSPTRPMKGHVKMNDEVEKTRLCDDLIKPFDSIDIPIIILGDDQRILRFTPMAKKIIDVTSSDLGRPISDFTLHINVPNLDQLIQDVIKNASIKEQNVQDQEGHWYSMRIKPYWSIDKKINGVMILLIDIDSLMNKEQALCYERDKLIHILDSIEDGVYIANQQHDIEYINPILVKEFGPLKGRKCYTYFHNRDEVCPWCKNREVLTGKSIRWTWYSSKTDKIYELIDAPFKNPDGSILQLKIFRDITERKKAEEVLQENEKKYRQLIENLHKGIWVFDKDASTTYVNSYMAKILGYTVDEIQGKPISLYMDENSAQKWRRDMENREQDINGQIDFEFIHKMGNRVYTNIETSNIIDEQGNYIGKIAYVTDISDSKKIQEALRESEEQYRNIIHSMGDAIHMVDTDLRFILFNNAFNEWNKKLGITTDVIGKRIFEVFPFLRDSVRNEYKQVFDTGKTLITEEFNKIGGKEFITEVRKIPLFEEERVNKIVTIVRDITERKKGEEALKNSEEKYSNLFQHSNDGIILHDLAGRIIDVNQKALSLFGYTKAEVLSLEISDLHPKGALNKSEYAFQKISQDGFVRFEIDFEKKNGEIFPAEVSSSLFEVGGRKIIQGIIRDITERKKAEKALKDSETKFRALSEYSPNMIFINKGGRVVYANKKSAEITGYEKEEFYSLDFDFFTLIAPESRDTIKVNFNRHTQGEDILPYEYTIITKKGEKIEALLTTKLINYGGEKAILGIVTDITKLKKAEEVLKRDKESFERLVNEKTMELLQTQKKLADAKRLSDIGTLAATVAHELRNPLAVIRTAAYNIKRKSQNPLLDKHISNIERNILEGNQIINNLLFYSRIQTPHYQSINIFNILNECILSVKQRFKKKGVSINHELKSIENISIEADPLQIKEVFANILNNAYDAMIDNKSSLEIGAGAECCDRGGFIKVYFKDTGTGISKEVLKSAYEPFFSTKSKGTGLGLTVCKQIVHLHNGKIDIESEKGYGTTVKIMLPIKRK